MTADTVVRARIDAATKDQATEALAAMGLSVSDAIRLLLVRVAADKEFPFPVKVPNATTRRPWPNWNGARASPSPRLRSCSRTSASDVLKPVCLTAQYSA
jgi:DNA-damage-inducible protein J